MSLQLWYPFFNDGKNRGLSSSQPEYKNLFEKTSLIDYKYSGDFTKDKGFSTEYIHNPLKQSQESISFWIFLNEKSDSGFVFRTKNELYNKQIYTYCLKYDVKRFSFINGNTKSSATFPPIRLKWFHICIVSNYDLAKIYVNGILSSSCYCSFPEKNTILGENDKIVIGYDESINEDYTCNFLLNDFRLYNTSLSEEDVKRIYQTKLFEFENTFNLENGTLNDRSGQIIGGKLYNNNVIKISGLTRFNNSLAYYPKINDFFSNYTTVSIWFYVDDNYNDNYLLYSNENLNYFIKIINDGTSKKIQITNYDKRNLVFIFTPKINDINHICVTFQYVNPILFINGNLIKSTESTIGIEYDTENNINIGQNLFGFILNISVYYNALKSDEVTRLYESEKYIYSLKNLKTHDYVDLGLPSGTLWSTDYIKDLNGKILYFGWGEAQGYTSGQVGTYKNFSFDDYAFGVYDTGDTINYGYTKYNADDGKTTLDTEDDAAFFYWGENWRIPTLEQFEELMNSEYTTFTWNSNNNSATFTSKINGNSITFLSYGYVFDGQIYYYNQEIATFTKSALDVNAAGGVSIWNGGKEIFSSYRNLGVPIRPVVY